MGPLAQVVANPWTPQSVLVSVLGGAIGITLLGIIAVYFLRGLWSKFGEDGIKAVIVAWNIHPDQQKSQESFVKKIIDNEIRRDDGLISREITTKNDAMEERLISAIEGLRIDTVFKDNVLHELGEIQGKLSIMVKGKEPDPPPREEREPTGRHKVMR